MNRRRARRRVSENMRRPPSETHICPASLAFLSFSLSLFKRTSREVHDSPLVLFRRNVRTRFRALDDDGLSRTRTYTNRARTLNGERRERERTHRRGRSSYSGRCVVYRAAGSRQRSVAPTTKRSFLRRHRSSLSRSATVVHVRPRSAGKCVYTL